MASNDFRQLVLATANPGKLAEFKQMFQQIYCDILSQDAFDVMPVAETGLTFIENALLKARAASQASGLPALADDSGIEVDALNGQPGIYSARFAGENAKDQDNNLKLLQAMKDIPEAQRTARYQCVIVLLKNDTDPSPLIFNGTWEGRVLEKPLGDKGFGYDPLFFVPEENCTAAQLTAEQKNLISHRGKAIRALCNFMF